MMRESDPPKTINIYEALITSLSLSLIPNPESETDRKNPKPSSWFDRDCVKLKNQVRKIYHQYRLSGEVTIPDIYFAIKNQLRQLSQENKQTYALAQWEKLKAAVNHKNSKQVWSIVTGFL